MNKQKLKNAFRGLAASVAVCALSAVGHGQISLDFDVSDSFIEVGDIFSVDVVMKGFTSDFDLYNYAFNVDPSSSLSHVSFLGAELPIWGIDFGPYDVDVLTDPIQRGGADITLATLNFQAVSAGLDTVDVLGNDGVDTGVFYDDFTDPDFPVSRTFGIDESFQLSVQAVPEPSTYALIGLSVLALGFMKRRRSKQRVDSGC